MTGMESALLFLWFNQSPLQHPGISFPSEAEKCDTPLMEEQPLLSYFKDGNHHFCQTPQIIEEACHPRKPKNMQILQYLRAYLIHP